MDYYTKFTHTEIATLSKSELEILAALKAFSNGSAGCFTGKNHHLANFFLEKGLRQKPMHRISLHNGLKNLVKLGFVEIKKVGNNRLICYKSVSQMANKTNNNVSETTNTMLAKNKHDVSQTTTKVLVKNKHIHQSNINKNITKNTKLNTNPPTPHNDLFEFWNEHAKFKKDKRLRYLECLKQLIKKHSLESVRGVITGLIAASKAKFTGDFKYIPRAINPEKLAETTYFERSEIQLANLVMDKKTKGVRVIR